jgi:glycosyltransferase involved in cell wall biosynthesis
VKEHDIRIIQTSSSLCIPQIYLYKKLFGLHPVIYDLLGIRTSEIKAVGAARILDSIKYNSYLLLERLSYKCCDVFITINNPHKKILSSKTNKPIYIIRDGVNNECFNEPSSGTPMVFHKEKGDIILIFVGSINNHRLDPLFSIMPKLTKMVSNLKILIVGSGGEAQKYYNIASDQGLINDRVFFIGSVPYADVPSYLAISDIAYSDIWSNIGFPMKVYEYMAAGKAIIIDNTDSAREVLEDGVDALLVNDEEDLLDKLLTLSKDEALREMLGNNARRKASVYSWDACIDSLLEIYKSALYQGHN